MPRTSQQTKRPRTDSNVEPSKPRTASDIINSFLKKKEKRKTDSNVPKFRSALDVINSFLRKEKPANEPNPKKFRSALDVINFHLQKTNKESRKSSHKRKRNDSSTTDSDSSVENILKRRKIDSNTPNNSTQKDSQRSEEPQVLIDRSDVEKSNDNSSQHANDAIKSRETIRLSTQLLASTFIPTMSIECSLPEDSDQQVTRFSTTLDKSSSSNLSRANLNTCDDVQDEIINCPTSNNEGRLDTTLGSIHATSNLNLSRNDFDNNADGEQNGQSAQNELTERSKSSSSVKKPAQQQNIPKMRQGIKWIRKPIIVPDESGKVRDVFLNVYDYKISKSKYDQTLEILNSDENRYDETPVNYAHRYVNDNKRKKCQNRKFNEATYNHEKIESIRPTSLSRVIWEMSICLKNENWTDMAELVYFGCDIMNPHDRASSKGTSFFTYALLGLLMDSKTDSLSTLERKNSTLVKYFKALGAEEDEYEPFMQELNLIPKEIDTM